MVIIDNGIIDKLLGDPQVLAAIPALRNPPMVDGRQAGCCGVPSAIDYAAIKTQLAGLDTQTVGMLKRKLNTDKIRFFRPGRTKEGKAGIVRVTR